jgi:benzoyl-CoA reductase/2-hydroxyglutaryl-CoA dehydratase subunit BcrC/BadD/HgdB
VAVNDEPFPAINEINGLLKRHREIIARSSKPVIGWFCSYTPLEILLAAGLYPYRILPEPGRSITRADGYIDRNFCPYVRTCLGGALEGEYSFLGGLVVVNSCDPMRRLHDVWRYNVGGGFNHLLDLPRVNGPDAAAYYRECLQKLVTEIESHFKVEITPAALAEAVTILNKSRSMLRGLYLVNRDRGLPLTAAEVRTVVRAGATLSADVFNALLERLLSEIGNSAAREAEGPRILITGSVMDNHGILELIEGGGARVVADDLCTGTRLFWDTVESASADPLTDLSRHYLGRTPCPRMRDAARRFDHVIRLIDEFRVDGVIFYTLKFCDPHLFDVPLLKARLAEKGLPVLSLEGDYTPGTLGRVRTRIEAFIEMLRQDVHAVKK